MLAKQKPIFPPKKRVAGAILLALPPCAVLLLLLMLLLVPSVGGCRCFVPRLCIAYSMPNGKPRGKNSPGKWGVGTDRPEGVARRRGKSFSRGLTNQRAHNFSHPNLSSSEKLFLGGPKYTQYSTTKHFQNWSTPPTHTHNVRKGGHRGNISKQQQTDSSYCSAEA